MENWNRTTGSKCYILKYDISLCVDKYFSQAPLLIPGYEEKRSDVVGCCGVATGMQQAYPRSLILRASTVSQTIIIPIYRISEHQTPGTAWFLGFFYMWEKDWKFKKYIEYIAKKKCIWYNANRQRDYKSMRTKEWKPSKLQLLGLSSYFIIVDKKPLG